MDPADLLERRIPDVVSIAGLPAPLAAEIDFFAGRVDAWCEPVNRDARAIAARALALRRRDAEARACLAVFDHDDATIADLTAAAWAASRVGGPSLAPLLGRLETAGSEFLDGDHPLGPRRLFTGMLRAASGALPAAIADLSAAVSIGDARAPFWGALSRLELGRVLRTAEAVPVADVAPSAPVLGAARTFFGAGGYRALGDRVEALQAPVAAVFAVGTPSRVGFGVQPAIEVRAGKGLVAISHLIVNCGRTVSAAELAGVLDGADVSRIAAMTSATWRSGGNGDDAGDEVNIAAIRSLVFDDSTRSRMTKLLRRTIASVAEAHPVIGAHLGASLTTGHGCRYRPIGAAVEWER